MAGGHGLQALPIEGLTARLAGGFLRPIDPDAEEILFTRPVAGGNETR